MTKPLGYYVSTDQENSPLLNEMEQLWGSRFEKINNCQRLWMINMLSDLAMNDPDVYADHELDDEVCEITQRAEEELSVHQMIRLIEALISQVRSI